MSSAGMLSFHYVPIVSCSYYDLDKQPTKKKAKVCTRMRFMLSLLSLQRSGRAANHHGDTALSASLTQDESCADVIWRDSPPDSPVLEEKCVLSSDCCAIR